MANYIPPQGIRTNDRASYSSAGIRERVASRYNQNSALGGRLSNSVLRGNFNNRGSFRNGNFDLFDSRNGLGFDTPLQPTSYTNTGRTASTLDSRSFSKKAANWGLGMDVAGFFGQMLMGAYSMFNQPDTIYINSQWAQSTSSSKGGKITSR